MVIEANIDDMSPQVYGHLIERCLAAGALDATVSPLIMKKGRPGCLVQVLASPETSGRLEALVLGETTTLGVRKRIETVDTPYGKVRIKVASLDGADRDAQPEFDDCRALALEASVPLREIQRAALEAYAARRNPSPRQGK